VDDKISAIFQSMPGWLALPFSIASTVAATAGAGLMLWAASYGDFTPAVWAAGAFAAAGLLWQLADRTAHGG
jgi:hypothetical protein